MKWGRLSSKAEFEESLHPRDSSGKFTESGRQHQNGYSDNPRLIMDIKRGELINAPKYPKNQMKNKPLNAKPDLRPIMSKQEVEGLKREIGYLQANKPTKLLKYKKLGQTLEKIHHLTKVLANPVSIPAKLMVYELVDSFSKKVVPYFTDDKNTQKREKSMKWGRLLTKADFNEAEHLRASDGKFTGSGRQHQETPRKRIGVDTWAHGKLKDLKDHEKTLRSVEKLGEGMVKQKKMAAAMWAAKAGIAVGVGVGAYYGVQAILKKLQERSEESKKMDTLVKARNSLIETVSLFGPVTAQKLRQSLKADITLLQEYVESGDAPTIERFIEILKMPVEERQKWFDALTDEEAEDFVASVMAEYEEMQAEKFDETQERWPAGSPDGMGGKWKPTGKSKETGTGGGLRGTRATETKETKGKRGRPSKEESAAKNKEKIRGMGKKQLVKSIILATLGAAASQLGEKVWEVADAYIDGWIEGAKTRSKDFAAEKISEAGQKVADKLKPKEEPEVEKRSVGRPRTKPIEEKEKRPVGRPKKEPNTEKNDWGKLLTKEEAEKANKGPFFRNSAGQFAGVHGNTSKPTWRDSYMQTHEDQTRMNPPSPLMTGSFMNPSKEGGSE